MSRKGEVFFKCIGVEGWGGCGLDDFDPKQGTEYSVINDGCYYVLGINQSLCLMCIANAVKNTVRLQP